MHIQEYYYKNNKDIMCTYERSSDSELTRSIGWCSLSGEPRDDLAPHIHCMADLSKEKEMRHRSQQSVAL